MMKSKINGWLAAILAVCFLLFASTGMADTGQAHTMKPLLEHITPALLDLAVAFDSAVQAEHSGVEVTHDVNADIALVALPITVFVLEVEPRGPDLFEKHIAATALLSTSLTGHVASPGWSTIRLSG